MMDDPVVGGGIQHVADCLSAYLRREDHDDAKLIEYAVRLNNGAVFKRLGFLAERLPEGAELARQCKELLTRRPCEARPAAGRSAPCNEVADSRTSKLGPRVTS